MGFNPVADNKMPMIWNFIFPLQLKLPCNVLFDFKRLQHVYVIESKKFSLPANTILFSTILRSSMSEARCLLRRYSFDSVPATPSARVLCTPVKLSVRASTRPVLRWRALVRAQNSVTVTAVAVLPADAAIDVYPHKTLRGDDDGANAILMALFRVDWRTCYYYYIHAVVRRILRRLESAL